MLSLDSDPSMAHTSIDLMLADVKVRVASPATRPQRARRDVVQRSALRRRHAGRPHDFRRPEGRGLGNRGGRRFAQGARRRSARLPQVAGAAVTTAIGSAAASRAYTTLRASVIEKDGRALALIGDDWESAITLGDPLARARLELHRQRQRAARSRARSTCSAMQKSLYVNSSSVVAASAALSPRRRSVALVRHRAGHLVLRRRSRAKPATAKPGHRRHGSAASSSSTER